jgi:hypothetical protein
MEGSRTGEGGVDMHPEPHGHKVGARDRARCFFQKNAVLLEEHPGSDFYLVESTRRVDHDIAAKGVLVCCNTEEIVKGSFVIRKVVVVNVMGVAICKNNIGFVELQLREEQGN